jgi:CRISPR-associated endonuclease Cas1
VSGDKAETAPAAAPATAPPHSWLARLASRTPQILTADGQLRPVEPSVPTAALAPAADLPLRLGESEEQGTVLFVTGRSALLSTSEGRLQVEREGQTILSLPWSGLHAVALIGPHHLTTPALKAALKHEVPIHFASHTGHYQGVTWSGRPGMEGYQLWLEQQRYFSDPGRCLGAARSLIEARLRHQREVLRQRAVGDALAECFAALDQLIGKTRQAASRDEINGFEGQATRLYYEAMKLWIPGVFGFDSRNRQPPRDPFNALLSLGYTVLYAHVETVLRVSGLLPWIGFYHQVHGRHAVLASDLMEPFRHLVERTALAAITRGSIVPEDFYLDATEGCRHKPEARRRYLAMLAERFDTPLTSVLGDTPKILHEHLRDQNLR